MVSFLPSICAILLFLIGSTDPNVIFYSAGGWILGALIGILLFNLLTSHALTDLIEGSGILCLTFDSTGVIDPFILKVNPPLLSNKKRGISTLFDRSMFFYLKAPQTANLYNVPPLATGETPAIPSANPNFEDYIIRMPKSKQNSLTFAFKQFPCLIFNKNSETFLSKDFLCSGEESAMMKHQVLYLKRKTEELTSVMRDFARYVIELTRPQKSLMSNWLFWAAIIIFVLIIGYLAITIGPSLISGMTEKTAGALVETR